MPEKVREKGDVPALFNKIFGEPMAEGVGVHHILAEAIALGKGFQLNSDAAGGERVTEAVQKQRAASAVFPRGPFHKGIPQPGGNIDTPDLISLGINILFSGSGVLHLKGNQLAYPHACGGNQAHNIIISKFLVLIEPSDEVLIICLADNPVQKGFALNAHRGNGGNCGFPIFQIRVDGLNPQIDSLGLVMLQQVKLVGAQIARCKPVKELIKLLR